MWHAIFFSRESAVQRTEHRKVTVPVEELPPEQQQSQEPRRDAQFWMSVACTWCRLINGLAPGVVGIGSALSKSELMGNFQTCPLMR